MKDEFQKVSTSDNGPLPKIDMSSGFMMPASYVADVALRDADVLFWGDTDHRSQLIPQAIYSSQSQDVYKAHGVKFALLEMPSEAQPQLDALIREGADSKENLKRLRDNFNAPAIALPAEQTLPMLRGMADRGIAVICGDYQPLGERNAIIRFLHKPIWDRLMDENYAEENQKKIDTRLSYDDELARSIHRYASAPAVGKVVVTFGAGHGVKIGDGLPELIEDHDGKPRKMIRIDLYDERIVVARLSPEQQEQQYPERPDLIYDLKAGTVYFTDATSPELRAAVERAALDFAISKNPLPEFARPSDSHAASSDTTAILAAPRP